VDDLVQFLRDRLDETAAKARAAAEELGADWYYDDGFVLARREGDQVVTGSQDFLERERGEHIALHDPARVLAEVEAKRRLVDEFAQTGSVPDTPERRASPHWRGDFGYLQGLARAVHLLALPYADHPDYRDERRP
jgi:hypothetical protein